MFLTTNRLSLLESNLVFAFILLCIDCVLEEEKTPTQIIFSCEFSTIFKGKAQMTHCKEFCKSVSYICHILV